METTTELPKSFDVSMKYEKSKKSKNNMNQKNDKGTQKSGEYFKYRDNKQQSGRRGMMRRDGGHIRSKNEAINEEKIQGIKSKILGKQDELSTLREQLQAFNIRANPNTKEGILFGERSQLSRSLTNLTNKNLEIKRKIKEKEAEQKKNFSELMTAKEKFPVKSVADAEREISAIYEHLVSKTHPISYEKRLVTQISKYKKIVVELRRIEQEKEKPATGATIESLKQNSKDIIVEINQTRDRMSEIDSELEKLGVVIGSTKEQTNQIKKQISSIYDEIGELRQEQLKLIEKNRKIRSEEEQIMGLRENILELTKRKDNILLQAKEERNEIIRKQFKTEDQITKCNVAAEYYKSKIQNPSNMTKIVNNLSNINISRPVDMNNVPSGQELIIEYHPELIQFGDGIKDKNKKNPIDQFLKKVKKSKHLWI